MSGGNDDPSNRFELEGRHAPRHAVRIPVHVTTRDDAMLVTTVNVSRAGLYIRSSETPTPGEKVKLTLRLDDQEEPLEVIAEVVHINEEGVFSDAPPGFGVRLLGGTLDSRWARFLRTFQDNAEGPGPLSIDLEATTACPPGELNRLLTPNEKASTDSDEQTLTPGSRITPDADTPPSARDMERTRAVDGDQLDKLLLRERSSATMQIPENVLAELRNKTRND